MEELSISLTPQLFDPKTQAMNLAEHPCAVHGHHWTNFLSHHAIHLTLIPWRLIQVMSLGAFELLKVPRHPYSELPRMVTIILLTTSLQLLDESLSLFEPFFYPQRLSRSTNREDIRCSHLYAKPAIPATQSSNPMHFWHPNSYCWGKSLWFIALYEYGHAHFDTPEQCLTTIAESQTLGATEEAILLQSIAVSRPSMRFHEMILRGLNLPLMYLSLLFGDTEGKQVARHEASMLKLVKLTPTSTHTVRHGEPPHLYPGTYLVRNGTQNSHEMAFIKISSHLGYVYEPNGGLCRCTGKHMEEEALKIMGISKKRPAFFTRVSKKSFLDLGPINIRAQLAELLA